MNSITNNDQTAADDAYCTSSSSPPTARIEDVARTFMKMMSGKEAEAALVGQGYAPGEASDAVASELSRLAAEKGKGKFAGRAANTVKPRRRRWLWESWVPLGVLSLLYGEEGLGKGNVTMYLAAKATTGELSGELHSHPANVDIVTFEDDPEIELVPRLLANGADLSRIKFHDESDRYEPPLLLPDDIAELAAAMVERQSRLLIIDPLPDALRENLNANANGDVRTALVPLQQMAKQINAAVLGVAHPNKGATTAANKVMGSKAWRSVPRSVMLLGKNPADPEGDSRILCVTKRNGSREKPSRELGIETTFVEEPDEDGRPIGNAPRVVMGEASKYTDEDLVIFSATGKAAGSAAKLSQRDRAEDLILNLLEAGGGEISAAAAFKAGEDSEPPISEATMRRVRKELEVQSDAKVWFVDDDWTPPRLIP